MMIIWYQLMKAWFLHISDIYICEFGSLFYSPDFKDIDDFYEESDNDANLLSAVKDWVALRHPVFLVGPFDSIRWIPFLPAVYEFQSVLPDGKYWKTTSKSQKLNNQTVIMVYANQD